MITFPFYFSFYYQHFLKIASVQECIGNLFNPFIMFSLGWTIFTLCLTIYFITQANTCAVENGIEKKAEHVNRFYRVVEPATFGRVRTPAQQDRWSKLVMFNLLWSLLQISVAIAYIITVCGTGTKTNEQA